MTTGIVAELTDLSSLESQFLKNLEREKTRWETTFMPEELGDLEDRVRERLRMARCVGNQTREPQMPDDLNKLSVEFYAELEESDVSPGNKAVDKILDVYQDKWLYVKPEAVGEENLPTEKDVLEFGLKGEQGVADPYRTTLPVAVKPTSTYTWWQRLQCFFGVHRGKAVPLGYVFVFRLHLVEYPWPEEPAEQKLLVKESAFSYPGFQCDCCKTVVVPGITKNAKYWLKGYSHIGDGLAKFRHCYTVDTLDNYYAAKAREVALKVPNCNSRMQEEYYWYLNPGGQRYECNQMGQPIPRPLPRPNDGRPPPTRIPGPGVPVSK